MTDLATTVAKSELWLATNPLNRYTVLDYLAITPFYEREGCVNEAAVAAGRHRSDTQGLPCGPDRFEYVVAEAAEPALYVIVKQTRAMQVQPPLAAPGAPQPPPPPPPLPPPRRLGVYYVLDGAVYQAPTLHAVFSARLLRCAFNLRNAFNALQERAAEALAEPLAAAAAEELQAQAPAPAAAAPDPAATAAAAAPAAAAAAPVTSGEAEEQRRLAMFAMGALRTFDATPAGAQVRTMLTARAQAAAGTAPQAEAPAAVTAN